MAKRKNKQKQPSRRDAATATKGSRNADEKTARLAHKILTQTIWPANLKLDEAIDVAIMVVKGIVLSNTSEEDLEDRSGMIEWIEDRFTSALDEIDPFADPAHAWIVEPQGLITEPIGILWSGAYDEGSVQVVLGSDLAQFRAEIAEARDLAIVTEGVEGLAITDPEWDGEDTVTCENPACGQVHDAHLRVAENLFQQTVEHRRQHAAVN